MAEEEKVYALFVKKHGYLVEIISVLLDVAEEEKVHALCRHNQRLEIHKKKKSEVGRPYYYEGGFILGDDGDGN